MKTPYSEWRTTERPQRRGRFWLGILVGAIVALAGVLVASRFGLGASELHTPQIPDPPPRYAGLGSGTGGPNSGSPELSRRNAIVRAVDRVAPAVATISVTQVRRERIVNPFFDDPLMRQFFPDLPQGYERERQVPVKSMGSGVIVTPEGLVLTNEHVIRGATEIVVNLEDGRQFPAQVFGEPDEQADLAVLKIAGEHLPVAPLGRSDDLMIGEWAIAIGNPFGFLIRDSHPTVTVGVVSALNRDFDASDAGDRVYRDMIQTDASINPGNSGGPLVNSEGYVIGINTFIFTQSGGSEGIGFAIPVTKARQVLDDILRFGEVRHNFWTGIRTTDLNKMIVESLGLESDRGAIVTEVERNSPGEKAGLRRGDVIVEVNGKVVASDRDVRTEFLGAIVGQEINFAVIRDGRRTRLTMTLEEKPAGGRNRE